MPRVGIIGLLVSLLVAGCGASTATSVQPSSPLSTPSDVPSGPSSVTATAVSSPATTSALPSPIPALEARLAGPVGLVFDTKGNLYVSQCTFDAGQSFIYRINPGGLLVPFAGTGRLAFSGDGGQATSADVQCPAGMKFGSDRALFFADHANNRVRRIDKNGIITTVVGSGPAGVNLGSFAGDGGPAIDARLMEPWGVAFDASGDLFIADRDNDRVRKVDAHGVITTVAGSGQHGFAGDGGPAVKASLCGPQGLTFDSHQNLLIADDCNDRVRKVDGHGIISTSVGTGIGGFSGDGGPATKAEIDGPDEFAIDPSGALLVSTNPGLRIRRIDAVGVISTIAGSGEPGMPVDGMLATEAPFTEIYGLAYDAGGNLFVADGNNSVYRIDTKGDVTLFAGTRP